jgi:endo-1,3(4)-beta-glucanase
LQALGLVFGISTHRDFDGVSIHQPTQTDWRASFAEHSGNPAFHKALAFDEQSVTVQYFQNSITMTTYLVPGSPYITLNYNSATPVLTAMNGNVASVNGQTVPSSGSSEYTARLVSQEKR